MAYYQHKDRRLHYQLFVNPKSDAPLVIYLHGLLMDNLSSGYFTFTHQLKDHAHILLYDLVGHGRSSMLKSGYGYEAHFEDLQALVKVVQTEIGQQKLDIVLLGCSFGGALALYSAQLLSNLKSIVLLEGHLGSPTFISQLRADLSATGDNAESLIIKHFQHWLHRGSERKKNRLMKRAEQLIYESTLLNDLRLERELEARYIVPILFLYGEYSDAYDEAFELYRVRQAENQNNRDRFIKYPNRGHALLWEETQAITQALCEWLNS